MPAISNQEVLKYVNQARTNPKSFADYVKKEIGLFQSDGRRIPLTPNCFYSTNEGRGAWEQAYNFLMNVQPIQPLKLSDGLTGVAKIHSNYLESAQKMSHSDAQGLSSMARVQKYFCKWLQNIGNDFSNNGRNHALQVVKGLIIDDGVSNRGHRRNIFCHNYSYIGIASAIVLDKVQVVMDFCNVDPVLKNGTNIPQENNYYNNNNNNNNKQSNQDDDWGNFNSNNNKQSNQDDDWGNFNSNNNKQSNQDDGWGNKGNKNVGFFEDDQKFDMHKGFGEHDGFGRDIGFNNKHNFKFQKGFNNGFNDNDDFSNFGGNLNYNQDKKGGSGGRHPVSTQTSTKTRTVNGRTQTITVQTIKYSDGSTETNENKQISY